MSAFKFFSKLEFTSTALLLPPLDVELVQDSVLLKVENCSVDERLVDRVRLAHGDAVALVTVMLVILKLFYIILSRLVI